MFDSILKALRLAPRFLFAAWIIGAIILFAPDHFVATIGVLDFRTAHRSWVGIGTLAAFVVWTTHAALGAWHWISARARQRSIRKRAIANLFSLSHEERELLAFFIHRGAPTQNLILNLPPARSLEEKGLMRPVVGAGNMFGWPYTIPDFAWQAIQERRDELFPDLGTPETQFNLDNYDRRMHDLALYGR